MGRPRGWAAAATGRLAMRSPGRPPGWRREHRQVFWAAIARGLSSEDAAAEAGLSPAVGCRWFREGGGMRSVSPAPLSGRYLSFTEREEIAIAHAQSLGVREIARRLGRSPSTISRELRRNAATRGGVLDYRATTAQWHADRRARRPKVAKLAANDKLRDYVQDRLSGVIETPDGSVVPGPTVRWIGRRHGRRQDRRWAKSWSPEQISNRLRADFPDDDSMRISHEAIYQALYVQGRGALRRELVACLRTGRALRVPRARTRGRGKKFVTAEVMISERPAEADDRAVPGHWEGDLLLGKGGRSQVGMLTERTTRFTMLMKLEDRRAASVAAALVEKINKLPQEMKRTLAVDNGKEFAAHVSFAVDTGVEVFFCDPGAPWQRGLAENTIGLLRQYLPRDQDLSVFSQSELDAIATKLNGRPRKTLDWLKPVEAYSQLVSVATTE